MMIPIKVYDNMNNYKFDNVNFEYGFKFYICMQSRIITSVSVQIIPLFTLLEILSYATTMFATGMQLPVTCNYAKFFMQLQ